MIKLILDKLYIIKMGDQFISGVNLDEVLDNVLKGNEYNDNPHLSVTMIKMD